MCDNDDLEAIQPNYDEYFHNVHTIPYSGKLLRVFYFGEFFQGSPNLYPSILIFSFARYPQPTSRKVFRITSCTSDFTANSSLLRTGHLQLQSCKGYGQQLCFSVPWRQRSDPWCFRVRECIAILLQGMGTNNFIKMMASNTAFHLKRFHCNNLCTVQ